MHLEKPNSQKGISLVEILVAVAIVGLLSAIVSVNLSGVREKARINKGKQYAKGLQGTLGNNTNASFNFEEQSGNTASDTSGNKNDATINGALFTADGLENYGLSFDGQNDYLDFSVNSFFKSTPENITVSLWVYPKSQNPNQNQIILYHGNNGEFMLGYDTNRQFFLTYNESGSGEKALKSKIFLANKWYHLSFNWINSNRVELLVDGVVENTATISNSLASSNKSPLIGASNQTGSPTNFFEGLIDEIYIYNWK